MPEAPKWFCVVHGKEAGPISSTELKQLAEKGTLKPEDLVRKDGMPKWAQARAVKGLFAAVAATRPAAPPPLPPQMVKSVEEEIVEPEAVEDEVFEPVAAEEDYAEPILVDETPSNGSGNGLWGVFNKVKESVQKAKENLQVGSSALEPRRDAATNVPLLEPAGLGVLFAGHLICQHCKTKIKSPPPEWGDTGICPGCKRAIKLPLRAKKEWFAGMRGLTGREEYVRQLADILGLDLTSPTMKLALDHAVEVMHPTAGKGGIIQFMQLKVVSDQVRHDSVQKALQSGAVDKLIAGQMKCNPEDPLVVAAGTPWKLFLWIVNVQFGGCHNGAHFEGSVFHPNADVNSAYFIMQNNLAYPDDPCTKFTKTMLENLLRMANQHQEAINREKQAQLDQMLLEQQMAAMQPAYQPPAYQPPQPTAPRPQPSGPKEHVCSCCYGKGWLNIGSQSTNPHSAERRCPMCGGQGVQRY